MSKDHVAYIRRLWDDGLDTHKIAKRLGFWESHVWRVVATSLDEKHIHRVAAGR